MNGEGPETIFNIEESKRFNHEETNLEFNSNKNNLISFLSFMNTYFLNYVIGVGTFKRRKTATTELRGKDQ